jgi:HK97 family phage prohead protease
VTIKHDDILTRALAASDVRVIDQANRTITARIMTMEMDRHGTVIPPSSIRKTLKDYLKNPVVLASHDHYGDANPPVVARVVGIEIKDDYAEATIQFATTPLADQYWTLYRDGFMRGFSIGFRVVKRSRKPREDGTGEYEVFEEIELFEVSCVAIPSNKGALALRAIEDAITRGVDSLPREQREFGQRVVEWMRAADARAEALAERLAITERELANSIEARRDTQQELDEVRSTLDALIATTGSGPFIPAAPAAKAPAAPTKARPIF